MVKIARTSNVQSVADKTTADKAEKKVSPSKGIKKGKGTKGLGIGSGKGKGTPV